MPAIDEVGERETHTHQMFMRAFSAVIMGALYYTCLSEAAKSATDVVFILVILSACGLAYGGVLWGVFKREVSTAPAHSDVKTFAIYTLALFLTNVFLLQVIHCTSLPTAVAVMIAAPFACRGVKSFAQKPLMRAEWNVENIKERFSGVETMYGSLAVGLLIYVSPSFARNEDEHTRLWKIASCAAYVCANAARHFAHEKLAAMTHETEFVYEQVVNFVFSIIYCLSFKVFQTVSNEFTSNVNYVALCTIVYVCKEVAIGSIHDFNNQLIEIKIETTPISLLHISYFTKALTLCIALFTLIPFNGLVFMYALGLTLMLYANSILLKYIKEEKTVVPDFTECQQPT